MRWLRRMCSTVASTRCWRTRLSCLATCADAGKTCLGHASTSCSMTSPAPILNPLPPADKTDKRRYGYSRDKRSDCVQVVIALIVTPAGFPLGYEVLPGNTADNTTLRSFLQKIESQYGKAHRIWIMDRGIPTEEVLAEMRQADPAKIGRAHV